MEKQRVLVIDNYDSFVYNLVHYLRDLDCEVVVKRNDQLTLEEVADYDKILLSPGPGIPEEAGLLIDIIKEYAATKSIFGVCLGMQAIGEAFGGDLINLEKVYHGVATPIEVTQESELIYTGLPNTFNVGRYHSWVVAENNLPTCLNITSRDEQGQIMSLTHHEFDVRGVQYHPESILTEHGLKMIENWVKA